MRALMRIVHVPSWAALVTAIVLSAPPPARAQQFDVPDGFVVGEESDPSPSGEWRGLLTVRPEPGPFSDLSAIRLRVVTVAIDDPDRWLKERLTVELGSLKRTGELFSSPDSPFADPSFDALREAIPYLSRELKKLAKLPLQFCEGPSAAYNAAGALRELYCTFQVGPFREFVVLRLQQVGETWYYTEIRAMNEKRLRHLIAIANSFRIDI